MARLTLRGWQLIVAALAVVACAGLRADEGMWTFDNVPLNTLKEKYNFTPPAGWLDHLRLSSVRFEDGGSGSFVSATGLVLTNHHVALDQLQKISTPQKNYVRDGFYAARREQELKSADLEVSVLVSFDNVTARVAEAVQKAGADAKKALEARKAAIAEIEKQSLDATGLRSEIVSLYQGSEYWLYRYKKYTDVRLVFAPEQQIAFFGGDPDNFTYPRYDLDFALFRVYENDQPITPKEYLKWNPKGAADGELVFVSGHPGSTDRLDTIAQLETERDVVYPISLDVIRRRLIVLRTYSARGSEEARQAAGTIFGLENAQKALGGEYDGLKDPKIFSKKQSEEKEFRGKIQRNAEWKTKYAPAWDVIAGAEKERRTTYVPFRFQQLRGSRLAGIATTLVRYTEEKQKPDAKRLNGYHEAQIAALELNLYSPAPIYLPLEEALLADSLEESLERLGPSDPFIAAVLKGRKPAEVAHDAVSRTKLVDPAARKALVASGPAGLAASADPLVALARDADVFARKNQDTLDNRVESVETPAKEKIGQARFAVYGHSAYPDATFTLRLSYGTVKGYPYNGTKAPSKTTMYGLYDRSVSFDNQGPFALPPRFNERRSSLDLATPLNFVSANDIIGGNSGSPVVNRAGELVGLIFDGNIESLVGRFVYNEDTNRAVAVHSAAIIEALRKLYDAAPLADEIIGAR
jgi:hypothetical protein